MKVLIIVCFCGIAFASCKPQVTGVYAIHRSDDGTKLKLDSNHKFEYTHKEGLTQWRTFGTWATNTNTIILNSDEDITSINGDVEESVVPGMKLNRIQFFYFDKKTPINNTEIILNKNIRKQTDSVGVIITDIPIENIFIEFERIQFFYKSKKKSNDYKIYLQLGNNSILFFANKEYIKKGNKLVSNEGEVLKKE